MNNNHQNHSHSHSHRNNKQGKKDKERQSKALPHLPILFFGTLILMLRHSQVATDTVRRQQRPQAHMDTESATWFVYEGKRLDPWRNGMKVLCLALARLSTSSTLLMTREKNEHNEHQLNYR